jgi:hypothetical protein
MLHEFAARHLVQVAQHGEARGHRDLVHNGTYKTKTKSKILLFSKKEAKNFYPFALRGPIQIAGVWATCAN